MALTKLDLRFIAMKMLAEHPEGVAVHDFFDAFENAVTLPPELLESTPDNPKVKRYQRDLWFGLIATTKAGWLKRGDGTWQVTNAGREALSRLPDAQSFAKEVRARYEAWKANRPQPTKARREAIDRTSASDAREVLERLFEDEGLREAAVVHFLDTLQLANSKGPDAWSITISRSRIRLNAGRIVVLDLLQGALGITADGAQLSAEDEEGLRTLASTRPFKASSFPTAVYVTAPEAHLDDVWVRVQAAHRSVVESAIAAYQFSPYRYAHASGVIDMLREDYDADIENPQSDGAGPALPAGQVSSS